VSANVLNFRLAERARERAFSARDMRLVAVGGSLRLKEDPSANPGEAAHPSRALPAAVGAKQFASHEFDQPSYLARATAKLKRRLASATERPGYRFRAG
jgi:hypothetical protein